jgi:hypothetical protein
VDIGAFGHRVSRVIGHAVSLAPGRPNCRLRGPFSGDLVRAQP